MEIYDWAPSWALIPRAQLVDWSYTCIPSDVHWDSAKKIVVIKVQAELRIINGNEILSGGFAVGNFCCKFTAIHCIQSVVRPCHRHICWLDNNYTTWIVNYTNRGTRVVPSLVHDRRHSCTKLQRWALHVGRGTQFARLNFVCTWRMTKLTERGACFHRRLVFSQWVIIRMEVRTTASHTRVAIYGAGTFMTHCYTCTKSCVRHVD